MKPSTKIFNLKNEVSELIQIKDYMNNKIVKLKEELQEKDNEIKELINSHLKTLNTYLKNHNKGLNIDNDKYEKLRAEYKKQCTNFKEANSKIIKLKEANELCDNVKQNNVFDLERLKEGITIDFGFKQIKIKQGSSIKDSLRISKSGIGMANMDSENNSIHYLKYNSKIHIEEFCQGFLIIK